MESDSFSYPSGNAYAAHNSSVPTAEDIREMTADNCPRVLLVGLKRSGKTSIMETVFHLSSPDNSLHLDSGLRPVAWPLKSVPSIVFVDVPGSLDLDEISDAEAEQVYGGTVSIVFVVDAMTGDSIRTNSIFKLCTIARRAVAINPQINIEVLIHKLDNQSVQFKTQIQRMFEGYVQEEDYESHLGDVTFIYHVTSVFNTSIQVALSKIVQRLIPQYSTFENLLSTFLTKSESHQVYLVDLSSRLYFAKDNGALDPDMYDLSIHYIDLMDDILKQQDRDFRGTPDAEEGIGIVELEDDLVLSYTAVNQYVGIINAFFGSTVKCLPVVEYNLQTLRLSLQETLAYQEQSLEKQKQRYRQRRLSSHRDGLSD
ncbi:GTP-binding protein gtr2 [Tieghemiomyces parasiticus]|uniref:GTP-binding protein n=1 Tax=Tieghemiomyces parasiticus TaxID=78921 RepID=A0A9W8DRG1_9FUNG|nr:GTP-binding protein gtr2 [Tieghemiomyces parasiticus]